MLAIQIVADIRSITNAIERLLWYRALSKCHQIFFSEFVHEHCTQPCIFYSFLLYHPVRLALQCLPISTV